MTARQTVTHWGAVAALVVAALSLGRLISTTGSDASLAQAPFVEKGSLGQLVDIDYATVKVTRVRTTPEVRSPGTRALAAGRIVVVDVEVLTTRESTPLRGFHLLSGDGHRMYSDKRLGCAESVTPATAIPWRATYCFDVPVEAVEGSAFVLARNPYDTDGAAQRRDGVAHIDLEIDDYSIDAIPHDKGIDIERPGPVGQ